MKRIQFAYMLAVLLWTPVSALADEGHTVIVSGEVKPPLSGVSIGEILVERAGKWIPLATWSPCEWSRRTVRLRAGVEASRGARYSKHMLLAVLTVDVLAADSEYEGDDVVTAERDLGWSTLQDIQRPQVLLLEKLAPESSALAEFPSLPLGAAVPRFFSEEPWVRLLALRIRVQVASRSLEVLADHREVFPVGVCRVSKPPPKFPRPPPESFQAPAREDPAKRSERKQSTGTNE